MKLIDDAHKTAIDKGWWDDERSFLETVALIAGELFEAIQKDRAGNIDGRNEELADTFIRWADLIGWLQIDIEGEIDRKMEINKGREIRHGKKY